jgi:hypothetical protein
MGQLPGSTVVVLMLVVVLPLPGASLTEELDLPYEDDLLLSGSGHDDVMEGGGGEQDLGSGGDDDNDSDAQPRWWLDWAPGDLPDITIYAIMGSGALALVLLVVLICCCTCCGCPRCCRCCCCRSPAQQSDLEQGKQKNIDNKVVPPESRSGGNSSGGHETSAEGTAHVLVNEAFECPESGAVPRQIPDADSDISQQRAAAQSLKSTRSRRSKHNDQPPVSNGSGNSTGIGAGQRSEKAQRSQKGKSKEGGRKKGNGKGKGHKKEKAKVLMLAPMADAEVGESSTDGLADSNAPAIGELKSSLKKGGNLRRTDSTKWIEQKRTDAASSPGGPGTAKTIGFANAEGSGGSAATFPHFAEGSAIGRRVSVEGYSVEGVLRFYGPHKFKAGPRCGIELDEPTGKHSGKVQGHMYFRCRKMHGLLCNPRKVTFVALEEGSDAEDDEEDDDYLDVADGNGAADIGCAGGVTPQKRKKVRPRSQYSLSPDRALTSDMPDPAATVAVVTHVFEARNADELDLVEGDEIMVLQTPEGGWWEGSSGKGNANKGWFPTNHVDVKEVVAIRPRSLYSLNPSKALSSPARESAGSNTVSKRCVVIHGYVPSHTDELTLAIGDTVMVTDAPDGGWWKGWLAARNDAAAAAAKGGAVEEADGHVEGWFPSNHLEAAPGNDSVLASTARATQSEIASRASEHGWDMYLATNDFEPRNEDECELATDDVVAVVQQPDGGWWEVIVDGVHGWVPRAFLGDLPVVNT